MMRIFDMGKNGDEYRWECVSAYSIIGDDFRGDPGMYLSDIRKSIIRLDIVPLSTSEIRELIVLLERTALELRQRIGED